VGINAPQAFKDAVYDIFSLRWSLQPDES